VNERVYQTIRKGVPAIKRKYSKDLPKSIKAKIRDSEQAQKINYEYSWDYIHKEKPIRDAIKKSLHQVQRRSTKAYNIVRKQMGDTLQITRYDRPILTGYARKHTPERKENRTMANEQNAKRARKKVYEIVQTNWTKYTKMLTLTYKENMQDYDQIAHDFKMLIQGLRRKNYDFPYLWVVEKQERGALHAHVLVFTDKYIPIKEIAKHWPHGFVKINAKLADAPDKGAYVAKYIQKETLPPDKKAYRTSRNIKKPAIQRTTGDAIDVEQLVGDQFQFKSQFDYTVKNNKTQVNKQTGELENLTTTATVATYKKRR
jgi:hypothetical protein